MKNNLAIIIAAAGCSSRLGQPKQLVEIQGLSLLRNIVIISKEICQSVICVMGHDFVRISKECENLNICSITNRNWQQGLGSSIALGLEEIAADTDAVMVLLCDQWALETPDLKKLIKHWEENNEKIIASSYKDLVNNEKVIGVPAIFPRHYFNQLAQLEKFGARKIILNNLDNVLPVELSNAAFDLDTKEDLDQLKKMTK
jgi:molybdenum cofactor cytidylyltransferase